MIRFGWRRTTFCVVSGGGKAHPGPWSTMEDVLEILVYVAMAAVVIVLFLGLGTFSIGGAKNSKRSNVFMRWRVGLQLLAIVLLALLVLVVKK